MNANLPTDETMSEGSPMPPETAEPMGGTEICVSLSSLAMPDEQEQMEPPSVGDRVQANIEGEVTRIEGENAYLRLTAVNGEEVKDNAGPDDPEAEMRGMAASQPTDF